MNRTNVKPHAISGFSLIELLVVIAIIGVMVTGVTLMFGRDGAAEQAKTEAMRLVQLLRLAEDEAQLNGVELGLAVDETGYHWLTFVDDRWLPITDDKLFRPRHWPEGVTAYLKIEQFGFSADDQRFRLDEGLGLSDEHSNDDVADKDDSVSPPQRPQIVVTSAGELTPFVLQLEAQTPSDAVRWMIRGRWTGEVDIKGPLRDPSEADVWLEAAL
ncbi:MAG: type II secretion system protein GspH [Gammaproteobacteria bacterium]|nr:MAG: type II secretion system protein GspH [Gammaproteobacteria bacterium]